MKNKYRPKYQLGKNNSESTSLGVKYYDPKLIADLQQLQKLKNQPSIGTPGFQDDYRKAVNKAKKQSDIKNLPNAKLVGNQALPINPDRKLSGEALPYTRAAKNDKFAEHSMHALDAAGMVMGTGALRPLLSEGLERLGSKMFRPRFSTAVDDLGYHSLDSKTGKQLYELSNTEGDEVIKNNMISPNEYRRSLSKKEYPKTLDEEQELLSWKERLDEQELLQLEGSMSKEWKSYYLKSILKNTEFIPSKGSKNYLQLNPWNKSGHNVEMGPRGIKDIMKTNSLTEIANEFRDVMKNRGLNFQNEDDVKKFIEIFDKEQAALPLQQLNIPYGRDLLRNIGSRYNQKGGLIKAQIGLNGTALQGVTRKGNYLWSDPANINEPFPTVKFSDTGVQIPEEIQNDLIAEDRWSMIPGFDNVAKSFNPANPIQKGRAAVGQPITRSPQTQQQKKEPFNPYFMLRGATTGLSWLANNKEMNRQNQYMYNQYSTLGQMEPANIEDFQPNYYSLYAKFGGKMNKGGLTPNKAREILHDKTAHGKPLTDKQRRFFGAMSKGNTLKY